MGLQLVAGYSLWLFPLCLFFGAVTSLILYYKNTSEDFSRRLVWILSIFRFLTGTLIAFLLLSPMVKTVIRTSEKPIVVIAIDNSRSMLMSKDSGFVKNKLPADFRDLANKLEDDFEVLNYTFGDEVKIGQSVEYSENLTDIADFFTQINTRFFNRNLGAVIMASDGIYNSGSDPSYLVREVSYPVFTINTGDTNQHRDLLIKRINYNRVAYKGNRFPIEILVQAFESEGESSRITVQQGNAGIFSQEVKFVSDNQVLTIPVMAEAETAGKIHFRISIDLIDNEVNESNNTREIIIEVKENKQKIAIIGNSPHPDLAAIERAVGNTISYETGLYYADNFSGNPADYSLFILHQIPSVTNQSAGLLNAINNQNIPVLYIIGNQSDIPGFNNQKTGLSLSAYNNTFNEALPVLNSNFPLFICSGELKQLLGIVPPLNSPFAKYSLSNAAYTLVNQGIGPSVTSLPLIFFNQNPDRRVGVIAGEGIWKWRMADYSKNGNHLAFDELIGKMIQYLAVKADKSKFRISSRDYYAENENIEFGATLFNESFELINDKPVTIDIIDEKGKKFEFEFTPSGDTYLLNAGNFAPGTYTFEASAETGTGVLKQNGSFVITALNLEDINTVANHRLLNTIAKLTGGTSIAADKISELASLVKNRDDVKPVSYARKRYTDLISFFPLLLLIIGFLSVEWFLRKFHGSY